MLEQTYISGTTAVNIAGSVEAAVAGGKLVAGSLLPAVRALATKLDVSPATVAAAYRLLQDRGVVVADGRRGTRVLPAPPITMRAEAPLPAGVRDVRDGNPDANLLPRLASALRAISPEQDLYGEEANVAELVDLAREQFRADGVPAGHIAIVSGALDGVERVLREHLRPGDRVAVEDPCFTGILDLLRALSLVAVPVAVDDEGMLPAELRHALRASAAIIVTPRAQNPTGAAFAAKRARELRAILATRPELLIIEDDHAGPVAGPEYRTLVDAKRERWAVVRSVSKSLGPDLRIAFLAADPATHARVEGRQHLGMRWVSHLLQRIVVRLWRDRAPARACRTYAQRRQALIAALAERGIPATGVSGLNVWVPVAEESSVVQALMQGGWAVQAGERYRIASAPAIRITTASLEPRDAVVLADAIARAVSGNPRGSAV